MRWMGLLVFMVATGCGDDSSSSGIDMQAAVAIDLAMAICPQSIDAFCATSRSPCDGMRDLATAMQSSNYCPDGGINKANTVGIRHCAGGETVIDVNQVDTSLNWVYVDGVLVAVFGGNFKDCVAGPSTFPAPIGCDGGTLLCT